MKSLVVFLGLSLILVCVCGCGKPKETAQTSPDTAPATVTPQTPADPEQSEPLTFESEVARLTADAASRIEKVNEIFTYVRDSVRQIPVNYG